jgi:thymidylate synthase ThyX
LGNKLYHDCVADLTPTLGRKRAKESARFFKTYNSQITADVMFNFRSFVHFQGLRNGKAAQIEIKQIAQEMLRLVKEAGDFNESLKVFGLWEKG